MKALILDAYQLKFDPYKKLDYPKKYKDYVKVVDFRDALLAIWQGKIKELAIPKSTPGYDFEDYISKLIKIKQLKTAPKIEYY